MNITLQKNDSLIQSVALNKEGLFAFKNIPNGIYKIIVRQIGISNVSTENLIVSDTQTTNISILFPQPCHFTYEKGEKPKCIGGHTDRIIPIAYGLPSTSTMKRSKKGLIHLGGCILSDCVPKYYCTIHKQEL